MKGMFRHCKCTFIYKVVAPTITKGTIFPSAPLPDEEHVKLLVVRKTFVSDSISRVVSCIGAVVELEPDYGFVGSITFQSGKRVLFKDRNFNVNPQGSSEIARDKGYTSYFLRTFGYSVPKDITVFTEKFNESLAIQRTIDDGWVFAQSVGLPVILKPHNLSQGTLISKAHTKREYFVQARRILKHSSMMVVQEFLQGSDFRIVVLDHEVISAYERIPLKVTGDGSLSILDLLHQKQEQFINNGRDTVLDFEDPRIAANLKRAKIWFETVLPKGQSLTLLEVANLSTGGDASDVTHCIHQDYIDLATSITRDFGLRLCGVDLMCTGPIDQPIQEYGVIEINSAPGLDNYGSMGDEQIHRVDELYLKVLKALEAS